MALACQEDRAMLGSDLSVWQDSKKEYGEKLATGCLFSFLEN